MSKVLVIGARGTVGSEIVNVLSAQGHTVYKATHGTPSDPQQVQLNVHTGEGIDAAFAQVERAFLMAPPGDPQQDKLLKPLIAAAQKHGLQKVVLMTAMGADAVESSPMRQAEIALEQSGLNYAIIRPNWFMQNFHTFWLAGILQAQRITLPTGDAAGSFIDARDIAAVAATLLTSDHDAHNHQAFNLTGAEALNHDEVAALLSKVAGYPIRYEDTAPEVVKAGLLQAGLPEDYSDFLLMILDAFKQGYSAPITSAVKDITGKDPIRFAQYAQDFAAQWQRETAQV